MSLSVLETRRSRPVLLLPLLAGLTLFLLPFAARAAEVIPPAPPNHFNDFAGIVPPATAHQLDQELTQFERDTSNQIVVAIYPKMQSDSDVSDYAVRVAQKWGVGQKERKNGAVLFVFQQSHDIWITTGYGLEGALPDALCQRIIANEIVPRFRTGDFAGGLTAGVHAMMAATRGEYHGTGRTARDAQAQGNSRGGGGGFITAIIILVILFSLFRSRRSTVYGARGPRGIWLGPPWGGGGWGGGGWGGGNWGGGSGGGGGSFSGGGGSFGGGGAGGKW